MKKLIVVLTVAALCVAGAFALDLGSVKGTWQDSKWDANWTFGAAGTIELTLASTGESVYTFKDANVQNFKVNAGTSGVTIAFDCAETHRSYKFVKPLSLNADLDMSIQPDWTSSPYDTKIKFQK